MRRLLILALLLGGWLVVAPAPSAQAAARVAVANAAGAAVIDATYSTTLTVTGSGFQSIQGGHGGIYVFFGTVGPGWRPSQGGAAGSEYSYVPDSESRNNQGFQKYVAFPGSDTAASANGGTISAAGSWSTTLVVPGPTFEARGRDGGVTTVDCRRVTCGVITVGAHGVTNAGNETFTPVRVGEVEQAEAPDPEDTDEGQDEPSAAPTAENVRPVKPMLEVDRASARAGHVLAFAAAGLRPGSQVSAVLDDGAAAAGPFLVGDDGRLAGVITIPVDTEAGTHELRLFGVDAPPSVRFAVSAAESEPTSVAEPAEEQGNDLAGVLFFAGAALILVLAAGRIVLRRRGARRAD